jgi:hypothetical protein
MGIDLFDLHLVEAEFPCPGLFNARCLARVCLLFLLAKRQILPVNNSTQFTQIRSHFGMPFLCFQTHSSFERAVVASLCFAAH